jgi:hypothetical protein
LRARSSSTVGGHPYAPSRIALDLCVGIVIQVVVEVAKALAENHPLIDEFLKGLSGMDHSKVEEDLVPETGIEKVKDRVLSAAHIEIHGHPVALSLF